MKIFKSNDIIVNSNATLLIEGAKASLDLQVEDPENPNDAIEKNTIASIRVEEGDNEKN